LSQYPTVRQVFGLAQETLAGRFIMLGLLGLGTIDQGWADWAAYPAGAKRSEAVATIAAMRNQI
jgi:hypothetical protein